MQGSLIDGRYTLLAPLGAGGEARVFRARDEVDQKEVAVRLLRSHATNKPIQPPSFSHPGWVQFFASGLDSQHGTYQVFELLEGCTLRQLIESGPLDKTAWHQLVDQSLVAVEAMHLSGSVHGDLSADNFFKSATGWKLLELPFTQPEPPSERSTLYGNIHTLAPERFSGVEPSVSTDLYALGCLYYYAACGEYPHPGETSQEVVISCLRFPPVPLREKTTQLPVPWCDWVMQLLASDAKDRFSGLSTARQLLGVA